MITAEQYQIAIAQIDALHNADPNTVEHDGQAVSAEWLYSERMLQILLLHTPNADYVLKLAAKCQHNKRWEIPRSTFEINKKGYYQWRAAIMEHQLAVTTEALRQSGIEAADIELVCNALRSKNDKTHMQAAIIEDVACLVFIKWYLVDFASQFDVEKATVILKKTAAKMTDYGISIIPKTAPNDKVMQILQLLNS
jgi:hypothetical protein